MSFRHPELVEGSLCEFRQYLNRDPSTPLRYAQDDGKEARGFAQDDVRYFLSYNQITRGKMTLLPKRPQIVANLRLNSERVNAARL